MTGGGLTAPAQPCPREGPGGGGGAALSTVGACHAHGRPQVTPPPPPGGGMPHAAGEPLGRRPLCWGDKGGGGRKGLGAAALCVGGTKGGGGAGRALGPPPFVLGGQRGGGQEGPWGRRPLCWGHKGGGVFR